MPPSTANEVLILFSQALSSPSESEQQANVLLEVKQAIEAEPAFLPVLYSTILSVAARAGPLLKRWIADIVEFTVARLAVIASPISPEQRAHRGSFLFLSFFLHSGTVCVCRDVCMAVIRVLCNAVLCTAGGRLGEARPAGKRSVEGERWATTCRRVAKHYRYSR